MLTKLVAAQASRCRYAQSITFRLQKELYTGLAEVSAFRRYRLRSNAAVPITPLIRGFSTSAGIKTDATTRNHVSFSKHAIQNRISSHEVTQLIDDSKGFLKIHKTMDPAHRETKLQQLLLSWGPVIKHLSGDPNILRQSVKYADSLSNIYLDTLVESSSRNPSNAGVATFVNPAIHGWAKIQRIDPHSNAAFQAESLLKRLLICYETTRDQFFRPRLHTFNGVLDAFSKSASKDAPGKAREWLQQMITDTKCVSPDRISFNSVLNAYASRGDAMRATALFEEMKDQASRGLQPDTYSYNMVMKAWQRSGSPNASNAVVRLLGEFKKAYKMRGKQNLFLRPHTALYSIPMSMVSAHMAHSLLDEMLDWHQQKSLKGMKPSALHYATVMNAYAKEGQPEKAEEMFMQMLQLNRDGHGDVQPNLQVSEQCMIST